MQFLRKWWFVSVALGISLPLVLADKTQAQDWCADAAEVRQRLEQASDDPGEIETLIPCQAFVVPTAIALLENSDPNLRHTAAYLLGRIGGEAKAAVPALTATLQDENTVVRRTATPALGRMGVETKAAVPTLIATLQDENLMVRSSATNALVKIATALYESAETADQRSEAEAFLRSIQQALQEANFAVIKQQIDRILEAIQ